MYKQGSRVLQMTRSTEKSGDWENCILVVTNYIRIQLQLVQCKSTFQLIAVSIRE